MSTPQSPTPALSAWRERVEAELAGVPFDKALVTRLREGLALQPLYAGPTADPGYPGVFPHVRGGRAADARWRRTQLYRPGELGALVDDLAAGTDGVWLEGEHAPAAVLAAVDPARTLIAAEHAPHAWLDALGDRTAPHLVLGGAPTDAELIRRVEARQPTARTVLVSAREAHAAGAHAVQELGLALATAVAHLRALDAAGISPDRAAPRFAFAFSVGRDLFVELAKLRAARLCWAKVLRGCGLESPPPMWIHAETSRRALTTRDPWVNMLRVTTQTFAAAVGGADSIASLPFDEALGVPDALGRRIARNTSIVLAEESAVGEVIDPAGGSHAVEALTQALARAAWAELQALEAGGGPSTPAVHAALEASWQALRADLVRRKVAITGVSEFPDPAEAAVVRAAHAPGTSTPAHRDAEPFEALRARAERLDPRPHVYLATLGSLADHGPREGFARGYFGVAGLAATTDPGAATSADLPALAARPHARGAPVVCIAGTDERYATDAAALARLLATPPAGARAPRVYLAGRPGPTEAALREAGVHDFIFLGSDVEATLARCLDALETSR